MLYRCFSVPKKLKSSTIEVKIEPKKGLKDRKRRRFYPSKASAATSITPLTALSLFIFCLFCYEQSREKGETWRNELSGSVIFHVAVPRVQALLFDDSCKRSKIGVVSVRGSVCTTTSLSLILVLDFYISPFIDLSRKI